MQVLIYDEISKSDEGFIEKLSWTDDNEIQVSAHRINRIVNGKIFNRASRFTGMKRMKVAIICCSLIAVTIPVYAAVMTFLDKSMPIDDSNRHLIGAEVQDDYHIIYRDGQYIDPEGKHIALEELADPQKGIVPNRIVREIRQPDFYPSSIVEISQTKQKGRNHFFPELILVNDSVCILTGEDSQGWMLESGDKLVYEFSKMDSQVVEEQNLIIGYVKDGVLYEGEGHREKKGVYEVSVKAAGTYYIYLLSASSDYLSLKRGCVTVD